MGKKISKKSGTKLEKECVCVGGKRLKNVNKIHEKTRESVKSRRKLGKRTAKKVGGKAVEG